VMPEFKQDAAQRERDKLEELAPYLEKAMARKQKMKPLADDEIPPIVALGRQIVDTGNLTPDQKARFERFRNAGSITAADPDAKP